VFTAWEKEYPYIRIVLRGMHLLSGMYFSSGEKVQNQTETLALPFKGRPELGENTERFLARVKPSTARTYRVAFNVFASYLCGLGEGSIDSFILKVDADNHRPLPEKVDYTEPILLRFNQTLQHLGKAPKTTRTYLAAIQGLAKYRKVPMTLDYIGLPKDKALVLTYEWGSADEVARFLSLFKIKAYEVLGALMFQSGLSVGDALSLTYGDVARELGKVEPLLLDFRREGRSKTGVSFVTFCGQWTINNLLEYLKGKPLSADARLFPMTKESVDSYFKYRAAEFLGSWEGRNNPCSPHSLRHGFRSVVHKSRAVTELDIEAFMGHASKGKVKMEGTYTTLSPDDWRQIWKLCEPYLTPSSVLKQG
jgi:integrase